MNKNSIALTIATILLIAFLIATIEATEATETQYYMVLEQGVRGLALDCVDELPYADGQQIVWSPERGFPHLDDDYTLVMQVVEVSFCNVDNIYVDSNDKYFRWGMVDREYVILNEGEENEMTLDNVWDVHPTRGAYWITLDD